MSVEQQPDTANTVQLVFQPTREEIAEVMRVRNRVTPRGRRNLVLRLVGWTALTVAVVLYVVNGMVLDSAVPLAIVGAVIGALGFMGRRFMVRQVYRLKTSRGEHRITIGPGGIRVATDLVTNRVPWKQLSGYAETERIFVLLHTGMNDINTTPLPKAHLTQPADIDRLREILDSHTVRMGSNPHA